MTPETLDVISDDFSTRTSTDQGFCRPAVSDTLPYDVMYTVYERPCSPPAKKLPDTDASVDAEDTTDMPPWLTDVLPRLDELATLQHNWDSYGSPPPTAELMAKALALVQRGERLLGDWPPEEFGIPTPSIVPLSGGGIQYEWQTPVKELELVFFENEPPSALAVDIASGETTERPFDPNHCDTVSALLAWLMSQ